MKKMFAVCLIALLGNAANADAQSKKRNIVRAYRTSMPKAVLVELFTHQNKIGYYKRTKQDANAQQIKRDADSIVHYTVADFNDNFDFCPVYYFYDTNASLILSGKYKEALLDRDLKPVASTPLTSTDTNYFIFTYAPAAVSKNTTGSNQNALMNQRYKSNILDYTFNPIPAFVIQDDRTVFTGLGKKKYRYVSKKFNISYSDQGAYLNAKLKDFYDR